MSNQNLTKLTADEIFSYWKRDHLEIKKNEPNVFYKSDYWPDAVTDLVNLIEEHNIPKDEAWNSFMENKIINFLVTKEGIKASGKKNHELGSWVPNLKEWFGAEMGRIYINKSKDEKQLLQNNNVKMIPNNAKINKWVENKYGDSEYIKQQAHNPSSFEFLEFMQDVFGKYIEKKEI